MLGIGPTSPFRLHAALKYVLSMVARIEGHVYLPLAELIDRTARQLDERTFGLSRLSSHPNICLEIRRQSHHRLETKLRLAALSANSTLDGMLLTRVCRGMSCSCAAMYQRP